MLAHRDQPDRGDGVGQRFRGALGHQMDRAPSTPASSDACRCARRLGDEHLADQPARRRGLDEVGALGEEASGAPPADMAMQFDRRGHPAERSVSTAGTRSRGLRRPLRSRAR